MSETKIAKKRCFEVGNFIEEEKWLDEQHKAGWKFIKTNGIKYYFKKCEPGEWIYQIDFRKKSIKKDDYIQIFADCGWEFVFQCGKWFYFRKKKEEGDVDISIFSDNKSKVEMCKRVIYGQLLIAVVLFLIACPVVLLTIFTSVFSGDGFWNGALPWIGIGIMVATSYAFGVCSKLNKTIKDLTNPLGNRK